MTLVRMTRPALLAVAVMTLASVVAADDKKDPSKIPPLDSKEWKKRDNGLKVWDVKTGTGKEVKKAVSKQKKGKQRSGKKGKAKSRKQAIAIGLSKARKKGAKVPKKKS